MKRPAEVDGPKRPAEADGPKRPASVPAEGGGHTPSTIELGTLTLRTEPQVEILWHGTLLGRTDSAGSLEIGDIPPGTYTITLRKPGHKELSQRLDITPSHQTLAITLPPIEVTKRPAAVDGTKRPASVPAEVEELKRPASVPADAGDADDPSSPLLWTALAATLIFLAFTAAWMMSRRTRRRRAATRAATPNVVLAERAPARRSAPAFFNDLKQREDTLDTRIASTRNRAEREVKIIEAEVVDRNEREDDEA